MDGPFWTEGSLAGERTACGKAVIFCQNAVAVISSRCFYPALSEDYGGWKPPHQRITVSDMKTWGMN
jgi:hypothetical protein